MITTAVLAMCLTLSTPQCRIDQVYGELDRNIYRPTAPARIDPFIRDTPYQYWYYHPVPAYFPTYYPSYVPPIDYHYVPRHPYLR